MNPTEPPVLEDQYCIRLESEGASIDDLVKNILGRSTEFPVLHSASAEQVESALQAELPHAGVSLNTALDELMRTAGTYYRKNSHPGMFSYVASPGLPTDPIGHALTAALNQNVTGFSSAPGATAVERTLIRWISQLAGFPETCDGLIVSGGSLANLSALATAVHHALGQSAQEQGIGNGPRPIILAAETAHFSVQRAAVVIGLGRAGVMKIQVDGSYRMDLADLEKTLQDLAVQKGKKACCVVASAGTTAMGVIDPLEEVAEICRRHGVWLHVDAAYGGAALLSEKLRGVLKGVEQADSLTMDLHKWCYLAFDASVLLYRDGLSARDLFAFKADYASYERDQTPESYRFYDLSPEVSRRNRALPAYLAWRHYGLDRLGRNIQHNAECAGYLAALIKDSDDMQLLVEPKLSICCFRYQPKMLNGQNKRVDHLNQLLVEELAREGNFLLSPTVIGERPVLRVCICSHTTRPHHMEQLLEDIRRYGTELMNRV